MITPPPHVVVLPKTITYYFFVAHYANITENLPDIGNADNDARDDVLEDEADAGVGHPLLLIVPCLELELLLLLFLLFLLLIMC